ncbi:MAG TPA: hypothetical protein VKB73_06035 [Gaiellaceae bacterium]|nr:hypothetical protein [Gaiellaceae bacterium]
MKPALWVLVALLASVAVLVAVEVGKGALREPAPKLANPCHPRAGRTGGIDATIQRIVLDGLDGAACRLHTTREELVISLAPESGVRRRWDEHTIEVAVRAGLLRSLDEAQRRGDIPDFAVGILRELVQRAPIGQLVRGGLSLRSLLGGLGQ